MRRRSIRGNGRSAGAKENVDWAVGERGEGIIYSECNPWTKGVAKKNMREVGTTATVVACELGRVPSLMMRS